MSEYVRLLHPSVIYSKKQLLQSQMEVLKNLQRIKAYHQFRDQELNLKIELKNKLDELKTDIQLFEKMLPKAPNQQKEENELEFSPQAQAKRDTLEEEIENIRSKLRQLQ